MSETQDEQKHTSALELLRELVDIMEQEDLSEVSVEEGDIKVHVKRGVAAPPPQMTPQLMLSQAESATHIDATDIEIIHATMPGMFYRAAAPEEPPFVEVGDKVRTGDTICVIMAMKLLNSIEAEFDCEIVEILAENNRPVEFDQPLFRVRRI